LAHRDAGHSRWRRWFGERDGPSLVAVPARRNRPDRITHAQRRGLKVEQVDLPTNAVKWLKNKKGAPWGAFRIFMSWHPRAGAAKDHSE